MIFPETGNSVTVEGVVYRASSKGKFYCPRRCHDKAHPAPSWRTEKGFIKHLTETCPELPAKGWAPPPLLPGLIVAWCAGCSAELHDGHTVWQTRQGKYCWECYRQGNAPEGYLDCAGLVLAGFEDIVA